MRCWIPETRLREFIEVIVRGAGIDRSRLPCGPHRGAVWLDGDRLEERCWEHIWELFDRTGTFTRTWMGFSWPSQHEVWCELQRDDGYQGACIRLEIPRELADLVRQTAVALHGGDRQAE